MNVTRIAILGVAAIAAAGAAFLARGLLGGGTAPVEAAAPQPTMPVTDVLVAASDLGVGRSLGADVVRWQSWPQDAVSPSFLTRASTPEPAAALENAIVRQPFHAGEPINEAKLVRKGQAGFMSAMIAPGKRALSIGISAESGAGGFILPNDRVDVILTRRASSEGGDAGYDSETILRDVRVLAIDQTFQEGKDQQTAIGKTATLELSSGEAELILLAQASGTLSLALRSMGESAAAELDPGTALRGNRGAAVKIIRYGVAKTGTGVAAGGTIE